MEKTEIGLVGFSLGKLKRGDTACISVPKRNLSEVRAVVLKTLLGEKDSGGIYVLIDRPFGVVFKDLKECGVPVERLFFIDSVSKPEAEWEKQEQVIFLHSPHNLADLITGITEAVDSGSRKRDIARQRDFILFDAPSKLLVYNDAKAVENFSKFLIELAKPNRFRIICIFEQDLGEKELVPGLYNYFSEVIKLT